VTNEGGNDVSIVDLATGKVTSVPVGKAPRKVVVQRVSAAAPAGAAKVSIANFAFAPATLAITAGESVTWSNDDGAPHGLAYKDGTKGIDVLLPGASFSRTYDKPGTFDYLCAVHPYMTGKVVVQAR
jgi:YVTN family beta-propeller protein